MKIAYDRFRILDVLLLLIHGMAPVSRKCWGLKDHTNTNNNSSMKNGKLASKIITTFMEAIQQYDSNNEISHVRMITGIVI